MSQYRKIITLGPSSNSVSETKKLLRIATDFRLNIAHLSGGLLEAKLIELDKVFSEEFRAIPVILDLQGAKARIGKIKRLERLPDKVTVFYGTESDVNSEIPLPFESFFEIICAGDRIHLNDKKVILEVFAVDGLKIECKVILNGPLSSGKGFNLPGRNFQLDKISQIDEKAIEIGMKFSFVDFALSFVKDGSEEQLYRKLIKNRRLIAKIETKFAFDFLNKIDNNFHELWLCRGDLGSEVGLSELGLYQDKFVASFNCIKKPKILAGEVLGSMVNQPFPSRSEVVHLYSILKSGFDGIVLSDETACGSYVDEIANFLADFNV